MLKKLRLKFVCIVMIIVTLLMSVIMGLMIRLTNKSMEQESIELMQELAASSTFRPKYHDAPSQMPYFTMTRGINGVVRATGTAYLEGYTQAQLQEIWELVKKSDEQTGLLEEYDLRYMRVSGMAGDGYIFVDISSQRLAMESMARVSIIVCVVTYGLMLVLSMLLAKWAVKPVELAWEQQKQFVADASHELKTPLTVIMTNAELLQNDSHDESTRARMMDSIVTMSHQMRGLVEGLLELARVDNGAVKMNFTTLELSALVMDSVLPFEAPYFERGLSLDAGIERNIFCKGSESHLRQVVEILLDNAMKYTSPNGGVRVRLKKQGSHGLLSVAGPGEVISQADLKNIFKRFYRIDKARSRDGSYGLGLSIAESIVREHRGRIWAESSLGINTFYVQLPLAEGKSVQILNK